MHLVALQAIQITWSLVSFESNVVVNFKGLNELCDRIGVSNERLCSKFDKFVYVTAKGPARKPNTMQKIGLCFC